MKKSEQKKQEIKKELQNRRTTIIVYIVLRFLVIVSAVAQAIHGNWNNVFLCVLTLILFTFPGLFSRTFKIELPQTLEIIVYLFIYAAEICGEIQNFYGIFEHWDTMLHTLNGFLCAAVGFSTVDILNRTDKFHIKMTPVFVALVSFCFSMTVGVMWEFFEFTADYYFNQDMQKDRIVEVFQTKYLDENNEMIVINNIDKTEITYNNGKQIVIDGYLDIGIIDTMKDLFVNFIGAVIFSVFGYLYIKDRDEHKWIERFILKLKKVTE